MDHSDLGKLDQNLKFLVGSSFFVFLGIVLSKLLTYFYRIIIARNFGPEIYGLFSLALIIFLWSISLSSFGIYEGIVRFVSFYRGKKDWSKINYLFRLAIFILFCFSIIFGLALYYFSDILANSLFHNLSLILFLKPLSFVIPLYVLSYAFLAVIQAFEKAKAYSFISDVLRSFFQVGSLFILILIFGTKSGLIIISYIIGILIIFFSSYFYCKNKIQVVFNKGNINKKIKAKIRGDLFSYSWPLIFSSTLLILFTSIDSVFVGYFRDAFDVGIYNAAIPIAMLLTFFPFLFIRLFYPMINREFSRKNFGMIKELSKQVEKWIFMIGLPLSMIMILFPGEIITLLFGADYILAESVLKILAIGTFFYSMSLIPYNLLLMNGKSKIILLNIIIVSVLNIILNILLIPKYGLEGAAFSTTFSFVVLTLMYFIQIKSYASFVPLRRKMINSVISMSIPALIIIYIRQFLPTDSFSIFIQCSFLVLSYLFLTIITRVFDKNDKSILISIKKKMNL